MDDYKLGYEEGVGKAKQAADTVAFVFMFINFAVAGLLYEFGKPSFIPGVVGVLGLIQNFAINSYINKKTR